MQLKEWTVPDAAELGALPVNSDDSISGDSGLLVSNRENGDCPFGCDRAVSESNVRRNIFLFSHEL